jgi:PHD/YefM family antitoxin component YafN of YafNO toxin-antitoxin module
MKPVVITKHGRDSLVVMSAERLKRRDRQVGLKSPAGYQRGLVTSDR